MRIKIDMNEWHLNESMVAYHLELGHVPAQPPGTVHEQLLHCMSLYEWHPLEIKGFTGYFSRSEDTEGFECALVKLALLCSMDPPSRDQLLTWSKGLRAEEALLMHTLLLQALTCAHPLHQTVWERLQEFHQITTLDEKARFQMFRVLVGWGLQHAPDLLLSRVLSWAMGRDSVEWPLNLLLEHPVKHAGGISFAEWHLNSHSWQVRELAARVLKRLGWQPRTRNEAAWYAIALRNERALRHLERPIRRKLEWFGVKYSLRESPLMDLEDFNQPLVGYALAGMEIWKDKDWELVDRIARYSTLYGARALKLLKNRPVDGP